MLQVEYVPITSIKPYKKNAKQHPRDQVERIKKSIQEFGFNDPIGVWHDEIVEGHGRYMAAQALGMDTVPVIRLDGLTDEQRRAYVLVHNKLTMDTGFDLGFLDQELKSILDINMSDYGFLDEEEREDNDLEEMKDSISTDGTYVKESRIAAYTGSGDQNSGDTDIGMTGSDSQISEDTDSSDMEKKNAVRRTAEENTAAESDDDNIAIKVQYNDALYSDTLAKLIASAIVCTAEDMIRNADNRLCTISMLKSDEKKRLDSFVE